MYKRILVPVDGSATSTRALASALRMARESGGQVRMIHALDELAYVGGIEYAGNVMQVAREQAGKVLTAARAAALAEGVPAEAVLEEHPGQRLGDTVAQCAAAWDADLVVVGTHGRRGLGRVVLGSGAEQIIRAANQPVLVIRSAEAD